MNNKVLFCQDLVFFSLFKNKPRHPQRSWMRSKPGVNHSMSPFQWFHSAALLWRWHAAAHVVEQKKKEDRTCNPLTMECICQCTTAHTRRTPVFSCRRLQQQRCWPGVDLAWAVPWGRVHWHHCCTTSRGTAGRRPPQRGPWTGLWQLHAGLCWTMFSTSWGTWERKGKRLPVKDLKEQHTYIWNCGEGCARSRHKSIGQGPRADCTGQCPHPAPGPRERKGQRSPVKDLKEKHTYIWICGKGCGSPVHDSIGQCPQPALEPRERKSNNHPSRIWSKTHPQRQLQQLHATLLDNVLNQVRDWGRRK